jgi:hypothetical protein
MKLFLHTYKIKFLGIALDFVFFFWI